MILTLRQIFATAAKTLLRHVKNSSKFEGKNINGDWIQNVLAHNLTGSAIYFLDPGGFVRQWNAGAGRLSGHGEAEAIGMHFSVFFPEGDRDEGVPHRVLAMAIAHGKYSAEGWRLRRDGQAYWALAETEPMFDDRRNLLGFAEIVTDLTHHKRLLDETRSARDKLDLALLHMAQGLCLFDAHERIVVLNDRFAELLGVIPARIAPGRTFTDILWLLRQDEAETPAERGQSITAFRDRCLRDLRHHGRAQEELRIGGRVLIMQQNVVAGGGWIATVDDVTERRRIEREVVHLAHHDPLTNLPNRAAFQTALAEALQPGKDTQGTAATPHAPCALLYIDIDHFKQINDNFGHAVGDAVLRIAGTRIRQHVRPEDLVARLGGDEFVILCRNVPDRAMAVGLAERLLRDLGAPLSIVDGDIALGASIGIAMAGASLTDPDALIHAADLAMYAAKKAQRGTFRLYEPGMATERRQGRALEGNLRTTLERGGFSLVYQPVIDMRTGDVTNFEALLRWRHPTRGDVAPDDFIPFAEDIDLMPNIDAWVIQTACREAASWPGEISVSVNLSSTSLRRAGLVETVRAALAESGLPAGRLEIEITETSTIADPTGAHAVLQDLRDLGVRIAIDDFGTGYASLAILRAIPFTRIKIDRSFIRDFGASQQANVIVLAILGICRDLDVAVTAEGVENATQSDLLRREGCFSHQGYHLARPMPPTAIAQWRAGRPPVRIDTLPTDGPARK